MTDVMEVTMDDQGNAEPVLPTDRYDMPDSYDMELSYPDAVARVHELETALAERDAEIAHLDRELVRVTSQDSQGNFPSARVRRREDQMDAAAIARWERETGRNWANEIAAESGLHEAGMHTEWNPK